MQNILIAGGTGLIGSHIVKLLSRYQEVTTYVLSRKPLTLPYPNVKVIVVNFEELSAITLPKIDEVYLCLGTTIKKAGSQEAFTKVDYHYTLEVAKLAKLSGANSVHLISSTGADANASNFYLRTKGAIENAINELKFSSTNIYRPGLLLGERSEKRTMEGISQLLLGSWTQYFSMILGKYTSIKATQLSKAMVEIGQLQKNRSHVWHFNDLKTYF